MACRFTNNTAFVHGGGANFVAMAKVNISGCHFIGNHALNDTRASSVSYRSAFTAAASAGGGLYVAGDGFCSVSRSQFSGNSAGQGGGMTAVSRTTSTASISDTSFVKNTAVIRGGAMHTPQAGTLSTSHANFTGNAAIQESGGAISSTQGTDHFHTSAAFANNSAAQFGGAFYCEQCRTHGFADSRFERNSAGVAGGALFFDTEECGAVIRSTFAHNSASYGGAILTTDHKAVQGS
jgi:predicted outer membrane repeat protein